MCVGYRKKRRRVEEVCLLFLQKLSSLSSFAHLLTLEKTRAFLGLFHDQHAFLRDIDPLHLNVFKDSVYIREVQLAKAAIRAGIKLLQKKFGIEDDAIKQVLLAGAFGNYIRRESALRIGLLPGIPLERIKFVGNAAASGAEMLLLSRKCRTQAEKLARKIEYVEIAHEPDFQEVFAESMTF